MRISSFETTVDNQKRVRKVVEVPPNDIFPDCSTHSRILAFCQRGVSLIDLVPGIRFDLFEMIAQDARGTAVTGAYLHW